MIEWEVRNGAERLVPSVQRWAKLTRGEMLRRMARLVLLQSKQRFTTRKTPGGRHWAPRAQNYPHPPLKKTGAMFRALRMSGDPGKYHAGIWEGAGGDPPIGLLAHWHQKGTRRNGRRYMPARPFVGVGRKDERQLETLIDKFVQARFR